MAQLVIALDFNDGARAISLARGLRGKVKWLKAGLELFTASGPQIVEKLKSLDFHVFLDLKFYDIPNTVGRAVKVACGLGVDMLTLHLQGGRRMCEQARNSLESAVHSPLLFGVTSLTSFAAGEMPGIDMAPGDFGFQLAMAARAWGMDGVVCSGLEVERIKNNTDILCLCPGIRPAGAESGDQRRVMTPREAVAAGADFLVVGRPVTMAADPARAVEDILTQM